MVILLHIFFILNILQYPFFIVILYTILTITIHNTITLCSVK